MSSTLNELVDPRWHDDSAVSIAERTSHHSAARFYGSAACQSALIRLRSGRVILSRSLSQRPVQLHESPGIAMEIEHPREPTDLITTDHGDRLLFFNTISARARHNFMLRWFLVPTSISSYTY
jgi:hypothetical protein